MNQLNYPELSWIGPNSDEENKRGSGRGLSMRLVSIILPTYSEPDISSSLERLSEHVARIDGHHFEILLVDDSPSEYRDRIRSFIGSQGKRHETVAFQLIEGNRRGKGSAVQLGLNAARGEIVFVMDSDLPLPLERIEGFLGIFESTGCDMVMAERPFEATSRGALRFLLSRGLFLAQRLLVFQSNRFFDTQCGFKAFRGNVAKSIAALQSVDGGMYDIEQLYIALQSGYKIEQVRVKPNPETRPSTIRVWKCIQNDPIDLMRVKLRGIAGKYRH